jgi:nucleoside-diphosphate-sugar epimerase
MPLTLITGMPGWLGTRLVRTLLDGIPGVPFSSEPDRTRRIRCLVMPALVPTATRLWSERVEIIEGDLRDPASASALCRDAAGATLFHCAGIIHPARRTRELFDVNAGGTRAVLQAAEDARVRRVIVISSNSPFGFNPNREHLFDEQSSYRPYMAYGRSKMLLEQIVHEFQERGKIETVIVRPPWFYGPDQPLRQTTFFRMIRRGAAPIVGNGENLRSMTYIDNLCQALVLCERTPAAANQTYWIADRRPYPMNEIVDTVERLMETEFGLKVAHQRQRLPAIASDLARLGDAMIQATGLYQQKVHVLSELGKSIACSIAKAEKELGYAPTVELEEGMRRSLAWCLEQGVTL